MMSSRVLPSGWWVARLGEIVEVIGGSTPSRARPEYFGGGIPWATPTDITAMSGRYLLGTKDTISEVGLRAAGLRILPAGSVLLTSRATIGHVTLAAGEVTTNQGFQNLIPKPGIDPLWLYYAVAAQKTEFERLASGSTFRELPRAARGLIESMSVPRPSLAEQARIAALVRQIMGVVVRHRAILTELAGIRAAAADALLSGRLRVPVGDLATAEAPV